jgi:hypothetical protein
MPRNCRESAIEFGLKVAMRTSTFLHTLCGVRPNEFESVAHQPLLASEPIRSFQISQSSMFASADVDVQAQAVRDQQDRGWYEECVERRQEWHIQQAILNARTTTPRTLYPVVHKADCRNVRIEPIPARVGTSQHARFSHTNSRESGTVSTPPMHEQQKGVIRSQRDAAEYEASSRSSSSPPLHRRAAQRRSRNPLFARPVPEDFDRSEPMT